MSQATLAINAADAAFSVRRAEIRDVFSTPFLATVRAVTAQAIGPASLLGQPATLTLSAGDAFDPSARRTWTGICGAAVLEGIETSGLNTYRIEIVPAMAVLTLRADYRLFQGRTVPDIAERVLEAAGLDAAFRLDRAAHPRLELRTQYGETDAGFLDRQLEEAGIAYAFIEEGEDPCRLVLSDRWEAGDARPVPLTYAEHPTEALGRAFATRLSLGSELRPGALLLADQDFRRPLLPLHAEARGGLDPEARLSQHVFASGAFLAGIEGASGTPAADDRGAYRHDERTGKAHAARRLEALRTGRDELRFATNDVTLAPGAVFLIEGHPLLGGDRRLLCTETQIEAVFGEPLRIEARAVFADMPYRPQRRTEKPRVHSMETAVVVGPKGEQIHTDEFGRVRVQFPWDREGRADEKSSCWVRVSQGWAGSGHGAFALPRVGQEVLIAFLGGDPDRPVIAGRLYNAVQAVPYKLPESRTVSGIRTQSTPRGAGYSELSIDDRTGAERMYVRAERDLEKLVRHDEVEKTGNDRSMRVGGHLRKDVEGNEAERTGGDRSVEIAGSRATTIGRSESVTVADKHTVAVGPNRTGSIIADERITLRTSQSEVVLDGPDVFVKAAGSIHLDAEASVVIHAAGNVTVKAAGGDVVITSAGSTRTNS